MPPLLAGALRVLSLTSRCMALGAEAAADVRVFRQGVLAWQTFSSILSLQHTGERSNHTGRQSNIFVIPIYITSPVYLFILTCTPGGLPFTSYTHPLILSFIHYFTSTLIYLHMYTLWHTIHILYTSPYFFSWFLRYTPVHLLSPFTFTFHFLILLYFPTASLLFLLSFSPPSHFSSFTSHHLPPCSAGHL